MQRLFFNDDIKDDKCRHTTLSECKKIKCWYKKNLTCTCLNALHDKDKHSSCKGEYLIGYSSGDDKKGVGAAIYTDCSCLCHRNKYYSPLQGLWV